MFNISRNTLRFRPLSHHAFRLIHESNKGCESNARGTIKFFNTLLKNPSGLFGGYSQFANQFSVKMSEVAVKDFVLPNEQPVVPLECVTAFENLTANEKAYAHHLSKASWYGGLIVLIQTSVESGSLFSILHQVFSQESVDDLKKQALENGLSEDEFQAVLVFTCGVYANMGNYKGFGDSKIIPNITADKLEKFLIASKAFQSNADLVKVWNRIKNLIYDLSPKKCHLGLGDKGTTTYFSSNCTSEDADIVNRYFKSIQMEGYNNRVIKTEANGVAHYEIRLASVETGPMAGITREPESFEGHQFSVTRGDYSPLLKLVVEELQKAKKFAANDVEAAMLTEYINSFTTGSLNDHKNGSRHWVKNKGPVIETYIGFIETYRDPAGMRGEFEGFVAVVNKVMSAKFGVLVAGAENFLPLLPWASTFETDKYLKPDFTSLDVLTFSGSGIPAGINIPNYGEIRQDEGFKNVSLGNVIPASYKDPNIFFISEADKQLLIRHNTESFELQVGLHELLGHGSGKLFRKNPDGSYNFDMDSVKASLDSGEELSWYEEGETYDSKFSTISSSYEECRAECVGLYLSLNDDVLKIFGHEGEKAQDIIYVNWLSLLLNGSTRAMEFYNPKTQSWMQAHSQARYVILQVLLEAGQGLVNVAKVIGSDGKDDLLLSLDRSKISTVGKEALGIFLRKLQVYKSTGNVEAARAMYAKYSEVSSTGPYPFAEWRAMILEKKQPRKIFVQSNTRLEGETVKLVEYGSSVSGMIQSWNERYETSSLVHQALEELWVKDEPFFV
ncbi:dipeptidyl peptidase 3-like isoform X1 [Daphnia pulicaria]|uniref:dipeptidyl peptidase 3-like isoform X1 n=2 Tax=Daphnia pulicaria TaxID=35523 RepID=UPI001EEAC31E|nr:dipeptidyl peptidase 3-like isoform X1 [Daphnia pulicaria]